MRISTEPLYIARLRIGFDTSEPAIAFFNELKERTDIFDLNLQLDRVVSYHTYDSSQGRSLATDFERRWLAEHYEAPLLVEDTLKAAKSIRSLRSPKQKVTCAKQVEKKY